MYSPEREAWVKELKVGDEVLVVAYDKPQFIAKITEIGYGAWSGGIQLNKGEHSFSPIDGRECYDDYYFCDLCGLRKHPEIEDRYGRIDPVPNELVELAKTVDQIATENLRRQLLKLAQNVTKFHALQPTKLLELAFLISEVST